MRKLAFVALILLGACQRMPSVHPYRVDVQQGNYVTQDMVAKLKPGMTRAQVRYALGAPLIVDAFHTDRWDYVYTYAKAGRVTEQRRIVVIFDGDKLVRVEGDVVPGSLPSSTKTDKPAPKSLAGPSAPSTATAKPEQGAQDAAAEKGKNTVPSDDAKAPSADAGQDTAKSENEKGFFGRMLEKMGF